MKALADSGDVGRRAPGHRDRNGPPHSLRNGRLLRIECAVDALEAFLAQGKEEATSLPEGYRQLGAILGAVETEK